MMRWMLLAWAVLGWACDGGGATPEGNAELDAMMDVGLPDVGLDAAIDAGQDAQPVADAATVIDAGLDAHQDAEPDAQPVDMTPPREGLRCAVRRVEATRNVQYIERAGAPRARLQLDVYSGRVAARCAPPPVLVYVHGGGWRSGDKGNMSAEEAAFYAAQGFVLVTVNYRLSPEEPSDDPDRVMHPAHVEDVAAAIAWVRANIADHGADPERISLVGFSAGAHLVSLVSTDARRLMGYGLDLDALSCTASLDTGAYDVRRRIETIDEDANIWRTAFGNEPEGWDDASPIRFVAPDKGIPDFFFVVRGSVVRQQLAQDFITALNAAGVGTDFIEAPDYTHAQVGNAPGRDELVTMGLADFFTACAFQGESISVRAPD